MKSILLFLMACVVSTGLLAQENPALDSAVAKLTRENDPEKSVQMMNRIIRDHKLDRRTDAEMLDVLYGTVAVNFAMNRDYKQFEKYIAQVQNKFNRTSFLNMAASKMLAEDIDDEYAHKISKKTLSLYESFRKDTNARPKDFPKEDWQRFVNFAQYPYYDTHAQSLFELKKYEEAIRYQKMAFVGEPAEGMPESVERYAKLLELTGKRDEAKQLLLTMARRGRLNRGMTEHLQSIYIAEKGSDESLGAYIDSLQKNVQVTLAEELRPTMLNIPAPGFELKDLEGNTVSLSDYAGKIVVLDLWATWCKPCIASFPAMEMMVKKHPEVAFLFIAVEETGPNPLQKVKNFVEKRKYSFRVLMDEPVSEGSEEYKIISAYQPNGIPAKYIIDGKGILRFKTSGFDTDAELMNELEAMFSILRGM